MVSAGWLTSVRALHRWPQCRTA